MAADMHVEGGGRGAQDMIVDGGDLEAAVEQLGHDGRDLGFEKHEVAHQHGFTAHRGERDPAAQCQRRFDGHAVERHLQIGPRQAVAVYIARHGRRFTQRRVDLLPVDIGCLRERGQGRGCKERDECKLCLHFRFPSLAPQSSSDFASTSFRTTSCTSDIRSCTSDLRNSSCRRCADRCIFCNYSLLRPPPW